MALNFAWKKIVSKALVCVFILAGIGGVVFIFTKDYFSSEARQFRRQLNLIKEREEVYKNDKFGGTTPEETLELFIGALKKGDTDLASKYFVIDKQEEWREDLSRIAEKGLLQAMVEDLEKSKRGNDVSEEISRFVITNKNSEVITIVNITLSPSGKWKIMDF